MSQTPILMNRRAQSAFSLIELVVTLLVMTMVTTVALRSVVGLQDQARYEQTRERLNMIREAILGDPTKIVNGQAVVSGFLADMGRLPNNIHELFEQNYCSVRWYMDALNVKTYILDKPTCTAQSGSWTQMPPYNTFHCTTSGYYTSADCTNNGGQWVYNDAKLGVGWRGPYLQTSQNPVHEDAFTDGWGNIVENSSKHNYGWSLDPDPPTLGAKFSIKSLGTNGLVDVGISCGETDYTGDCPTVLSENDYFMTLNDLVIRFNTPEVGTCTLPINTAAVCSSIGGAWVSPNCNNSSGNPICTDLGGTWSAPNCTDATKLPRIPCSGYGGNWTPAIYPQKLCLRLYTRQNGAITQFSSINQITALPQTGNFHVSTFHYPAVTLPIGNSAIAVHRYDNAVNPPCTDITEPQISGPIDQASCEAAGGQWLAASNSCNRVPISFIVTSRTTLVPIDWSLLP